MSKLRATQVTLPATAIREDLRKPHEFKIGDRVTMKAGTFNPGVAVEHRTGTVSMLPDADRPIIKLGSHVLGNELSVDMDGGGTAVAPVDDWELVS